MINVIVFFDLHAGQREAFLAEFHKIVPTTRDEQGCIEYGPSVDVDTRIDVIDAPRPDRVTILEKWESIDTLKAHLTAPHMQEFFPRVEPMVDAMQAFVTEPA